MATTVTERLSGATTGASVSTDRATGLSSSVAIKTPCIAATTANITLSGQQTIDGRAVVSGDRVLVKNQTSDVNNGIYVCDTGSWSRDIDFDGARDAVTGTVVLVVYGTSYAGTFWRVTSTADPIVFGTSSITFATSLAGQGDVSSNTSTTVNSEIALFSGTGGKTIKRATGSGLALLASGVLSVTAPTANGMMLGAGSSAPTTLAPGTSGNVATSNGTIWTSAAPAATTSAATQAEMEAASSTTVYASPGRVQYHPGVAKAWVVFDGTGTPSIKASHNVTSITDNGVGDYTINFTTAFSSGNYGMSGNAATTAASAATTGVNFDRSNLPTASACRILVRDNNGTIDSTWVSVKFYGDQ